MLIIPPICQSASPGRHEFTFEASGLASGVYISRLKTTGASGRVINREMKMQLVK